MILFPKAKADEVKAFLSESAEGKFGAFTFESAMAPVDAPNAGAEN